MYILGQLFGLAAMVFLLIYQQKSRKKIIATKLCVDVLWSLHYLSLGAFAGMIPNFMGIFRELVFINRKDKKRARFVFWPILFITINFLLGLRTFNHFYNILPITASAFVTISLWIDNPKLTKIISAPVSLAFLIYDIFVGSYIGIISESIAIISIIISFLKGEKI